MDGYSYLCVYLTCVVIVLGCVSPAEGEPSKYLGCYKDEGNPRAFTGHVEHFGTDLTPQKCTQVCYSKGFLYSATQGRTFCFCNDKHPNPSAKASEDRCSKPCSGNPAEKCGGDKSLSVWRTGIPDYSDANQYVGCFYNIYGILNDVKLNYDRTNSPRRCMNVCLQLGYTYAGVQHSRECHCGNERPSAENTVNGDECKWPCPGGNDNCGGNGRMSVYTTSSTEGPSIPKGKRFYVENKQTATWLEALLACARNNTRLASIDNKKQLDDLKQAIRQFGSRLSQYWLAGTDEGSEGSFYWVTTGKRLSSTSDWWLIEADHRQPDNYLGRENCVDIREKYEWQGYGLNDRICTIKCYYVCESVVE